MKRRNAIQRARRLILGTGRQRLFTRYEALVDAAGRGAGLRPVERALPAFAEALAAGTKACDASIWLPTGGMLASAAAWPDRQEDGVAEVADLAQLRTVAGVDDAVPVVDGEHLRGALVITKSGHAPVTEGDRSFMRDMASCCALLFRGAELDTELRDRVRRAEELGEQLRASQERLAHAREVERRRLAAEITTVTTGNLAAIRAELRHLEEALAAGPDAAERVLSRLRPSLDELIERFRAVVRGVYPGVLRDEGPRAALEELAGDLTSPVRFTGQLSRRVDREVESGLYYVVASALRTLGRGRSARPLHVHFGQHDAQLTVRVDASPDALGPSEDIRGSLADDADRVAALGGGLSVGETPARVSVQAWLPERVKPVVPGLSRLPGVPGLPEATRPAAPADNTAALSVRTDAGMPTLEAIHRVAMAAAGKYPQAPASDALLEIANRLAEPLRVALAGSAGAGKSTLVNALLGQELASTGAGGCGTGFATWYRDAPTPAITLYPRRGKPQPLEFAATGAAAAAKLPGIAVDGVDRLVVGWPAPELRVMTLIDLPGAGACQADGDAHGLLTPGQGIPPVDVVVYLTRHLRATDIGFLRSINDGWHSAVGVVVVLSRADEVGHAGLGALDRAERISGRYRRDDRVRQVCQTVLPMSPLLAASGATLREPEYEAFRLVSALDSGELDALVRSADRFAGAAVTGGPRATERAALLPRFGLFGVRFAIESIRSGEVSGVRELSEALVRRSGVQALRDLLITQLAARADTVKARSALLAVEEVANGLPDADPGREFLRYSVERIRAGAHEIAEITLIDQLRRGGVTLPREDLAAAERLLGAGGADPCSRLGLPPDADLPAVGRAAADCLRRWQQFAESPVPSRDTAEACHTLIRTCEGLLHEVRSERKPPPPFRHQEPNSA